MRVRRSASSSALRSRLAALARAQSAHQRSSVRRPSATTTSAKAATTTPTNSHELSRSCGRNGSAIGERDGGLGRQNASPGSTGTDDEPALARLEIRGEIEAATWGCFYVIARVAPEATRARRTDADSARPVTGPTTAAFHARARLIRSLAPRLAPTRPPPFNPSDDVTHHSASLRADADVSDRPDRPARPRVARPSRSKQDAWASRPSRGPPSRRVASLRRLPRRRAPPPAIIVLVDGWSVSSRGRGRDRRQAARASPRRRRQ